MNNIILILLILSSTTLSGYTSNPIKQWLTDFETEIKQLKQNTAQQIFLSKLELEENYKSFKALPSNQNLINYQLAKTQYDFTMEQYELDLLHLRFKRGLGLIQLLYEKVLSLDHHFTGMRTYQNVFRLSNPNAYPEFRESKKLLEERLRKKTPIKLPDVFEGNPFVSTTFSIISSIVGDNQTKNTEESLNNIACILDFTLRMNDDLGLIQYETSYLQGTNKALIKSCEELFAEYVKVIDYHVPLNTCRKEDDWEEVFSKLDAYTNTLQTNLEEQYNNTGVSDQSINRSLINLEFETSRVAKFVSEYESFIQMGSQYYQKFESIISNYDNKDKCSEKLPSHFNELQYDIQNTIDKFQNTYNLPEIAGSRMKSLLYGIN
jgi:hypothetical protein